LIETAIAENLNLRGRPMTACHAVRKDLLANYCRHKSIAQTQALRAKDTVSGRAFPWKSERYLRLSIHEAREGCFEIKADAVFHTEMRKTAFSARQTVQNSSKNCGVRMSFRCQRLHFEQNKNINSVDIDKFIAPD